MERKQGHAPDTKRFQEALHAKFLFTSNSLSCQRWCMQIDVIRRWRFCKGIGRSFRPWAASPAAFLEQAFEILTSGSHQRFTIHAPESSKAKSPHAMQLLPSANNGSTQTLRLRMAF